MLKHLLTYFCILPCFGIQLQELSIEEKVGQILMVHFNGEVANQDAKDLIQDIGVGGIIYYNWANGLHSLKQVQDLSFSLQKLSKLPLFIAVDQEGGRVARLRMTEYPSNLDVGQTQNPQLARNTAYNIGRELKEVGINMNLAPVVDVNSNPKNPVIGTRSFGSDPKVVASFGEQALKGYNQAGIMAVLKHFPGHGDTSSDSHHDLPIVNKSIKELENVELFPFAYLASQAKVIMTAHLLVPALDEEHCSTLSKKTLDYLKDQLGFQGVIMTDSLVMEGVLKQCSNIDEVAISAFNAGCDLLLLGGKQLVGEKTYQELTPRDIERIHHSLVTAVKNERISKIRLDQAVQKILKLKQKLSL